MSGLGKKQVAILHRVVREDVKQTSGGRVLYTKEGQSSNVHLLFTVTLL